MEKTDTSKIRLFYVPATADKPPTAIDFIRETEDGQLVSEIRGSTQAELKFSDHSAATAMPCPSSQSVICS